MGTYPRWLTQSTPVLPTFLWLFSFSSSGISGLQLLQFIFLITSISNRQKGVDKFATMLTKFMQPLWPKTTQPYEQPQGLHSDWCLLYFCHLPSLPGQCEGTHLGKGATYPNKKTQKLCNLRTLISCHLIWYYKRTRKDKNGSDFFPQDTAQFHNMYLLREICK